MVRLVALGAILDVGALLAVVTAGRTVGGRAAVPIWQSVLSLVLQLVGCAHIVAQLVSSLRQRGTTSSRMLLALPPAERRRLRRVVAGRQSSLPGDLTAARGLASSIVAASSVQLLVPGMAHLFVGGWVGDPRLWQLVFVAIFLPLLGVTFAWSYHQVRRARAFLVSSSDRSASV